MKKNILLIGFFFMFTWNLQGQQLSNFSQFTHLLAAYNPGYVGSSMQTKINTIFRNQWVGIEGAPRTLMVSLQSPFCSNKCGLGLNVMAEQSGLIQSTSIDLSYAYHLKLANRAKLSIGLSGRLENHRIKWEEVATVENQDFNMELAGYNYDFGVGLFYTMPTFEMGLSIPGVLNPSFYSNSGFNQEDVGTTVLFYMAKKFEINREVDFRPTLLFKINTNTPFEYNFVGHLIFFDRFDLGLGYRDKDALQTIFQYQITTQFKAGLAYDFTISKLKRYSNNSFEFLVNYAFSNQ